MDKRYIEACELLEQNKLEDAYELFSSILQQDEKNYKALNKLGVIRARQHMLEEAKENLKAALVINADYVPAIVNIGNLELEKGDYQAAIDFYKSALEKDESYYLGYYNMAVAYKKMGKLEEYFKYLKQYKQRYTEYLGGKDREETAKHRSKALQISAVIVMFVVLFIILK